MSKKYGFISDGYRGLNIKHHLLKKETKKLWGGDGWRHVRRVKMFADRLSAKSILDYGCGSGTFKRMMDIDYPDVFDVREYDPCISGKCEKRPEKADIVVCTDVAEHVEPEYIDQFLYELYNRCIKGVYLVVSTRLANEVLPDGSNAHRIVRSGEWWVNKIEGMKIPVSKVEIDRSNVLILVERPITKEWDGHQEETKKRSWSFGQ